MPATTEGRAMKTLIDTFELRPRAESVLFDIDVDVDVDVDEGPASQVPPPPGCPVRLGRFWATEDGR
jgi:hypothetical protein